MVSSNENKITKLKDLKDVCIEVGKMPQWVKAFAMQA